MSTHRTYLAAGSAALLAAGLVGCTVDAAPLSAEPSAPPTTYLTLPSAEGETPLEPGRYVFPVLDATRWPELLPVVSVPAGFAATNDAGGVVVATDADAGGRMLRIWEVDSVYSHPCDSNSNLRAISVGPTAADLAHALAAQPLRDGTDPVPVTIGGYDGYYTELSVPDDIDICLLYTSPSPRDISGSRMPSSA